MKIRVTLRGSGGELDCRVINTDDDEGICPFDNGEVNDVVVDIARNCVFSIGDVITIEEILE